MSQTQTEGAFYDAWITMVAPTTAVTYAFHFKRWMNWMKENGGPLAALTPNELIEYQRKSTDSERYTILDLLQRHVRGIHGRYNYKRKIYIAVRSFFMHSRADLPKDVFRLRAEIPPVIGTLTIKEVKTIILSSRPVYQAVFLCILQGGIDEAGVVDWSKTGVENLEKALTELRDLRREDKILRIELPGRKRYRNIKPFYTYVGPDAVEALENWLKKRPTGAGNIFLNQFGDPLSEMAMSNQWTRSLKNLGIIEPGEPGNKSNRYGKNLHEVRDVFRSQWEKTPAKGSVSEFMMGHQVDPLDYNKAFRDESWTLQEYRKALPMLQIMSSGIPFGMVDYKEYEGDLQNTREALRIARGEIERLRKKQYGADIDISDLRTEMDIMRKEFAKFRNNSEGPG